MRTFAEKILNASAGSVVVREPDMVMSHDNSARIRKLFEQLGGENIHDPSKLMVVLDRKMTGTTDELIRDYNSLHSFMAEQRVELFYDCDKGICHQMLTEHLKEGMLVVGNDSHTCTAGAFNCLAVGMNKTETARVWYGGRMWFRVPETIKMVLKNKLREGVYAKDLALWIMGMLKEENVAYKSLEFHGDGVPSLSIADRMTVANVAAEIGLKNAVFPPDDVLADYFGDYAIHGVWADENATYSKEYVLDLSKVTPLVMEVGAENEIRTVGEWGDLEIQQGLIGACASGRLEDLRVVARILEGKKIAEGFQLSVVPASREIYLQAIEEGIIAILAKAGVSILGSSCGPCLGSSHMIQADTRRFITTVNSNSMRRLSDVGVEKYVASAATIAMTALNGRLTTEYDFPDALYPFWALPAVRVTAAGFEQRYNRQVWNYGDLNNVACEQLFDEKRTYHIPLENRKAMLPYLLEGLDTTFSKQVKEGEFILGGENFGCGKLIKHAAVGLAAAGLRAILVKSADRRFYRMAIAHRLWIIVAPEVVEQYRPGDELRLEPEDGRIYLNGREFNLPAMDTAFLEVMKEKER